MVICPNCGNQAGEGAIFCDQCGTRLPKPDTAAPAPAPAGGSVICPACNAPNVPGEAFCDYCGSPLAAPEPTVEAAPTPAPAAEAAVTPPAGEPAPAAAGAGPACPACGTPVQPDEAFCPNCGVSLAQPPIPPEPVAEIEPAPPPPPPPAPLLCPACGAEVEAGDTFCSHCGAALKAAPPPTPAPVEAAPLVPPPPSPPVAGPRLIVAASGAEIPLPVGKELLIGREDPVSGIFPDVDLTPHGGEEGGVSRRHARLLVEGNRFFIEDLDSTNFTFVNKQKLAPKTRQPIQDGDEIRCGRVALIFRD